jgi:riboflavin kinase/FMN adenylyltransferase
MTDHGADAPRPPSNTPSRDWTVMTVGTFDGIHRGHQELLRRLRAKADELGRPSVLVTFEPHPLEVVRPEAAPRLLTTPSEKIEILAQTGIDRVVLLRFDERLAAYEPRRFVEEVLLRRLALGYLVIGYDHGFGRGRTGDAATLRSMGEQIGFGVDVVAPISLNEAEPVSSSMIRRALERGDVIRAGSALGRPYTLTGTVVRGEGRGRLLGFPTANIRVPDPRKLLPLEGIYAVHAEARDRRLEGVLHLGPRPTYGDPAVTVELFAFDFDDNLYDELVRVSFVARIRAIERFDSEAELVQAMQHDCALALRLFAEGKGVGEAGTAV